MLRHGKLPKTALVIGGMSERPQMEAVRKGAGVIVATPGRLEDYLKRKLVDLSKVEMLVLDESDRMLDMGFLPAIRRIVGVTAQAAPDAVLLGNAGSLGRWTGERLHAQPRAGRAGLDHQAGGER